MHVVIVIFITTTTKATNAGQVKAFFCWDIPPKKAKCVRNSNDKSDTTSVGCTWTERGPSRCIDCAGDRLRGVALSAAIAHNKLRRRVQCFAARQTDATASDNERYVSVVERRQTAAAIETVAFVATVANHNHQRAIEDL